MALLLKFIFQLPYTRHYNPLLNTKVRILQKKLLKKVFGLKKWGKKYTNRGLKWSAYGTPEGGFSLIGIGRFCAAVGILYLL